MSNNKLILIYGFNKEETELINKLKIQANLPEIKVITKEMASMKIKDIVQGLKFEISGLDVPDEKAIIINNLSDLELDRVIKTLRANLQSKPIFAVVTPTSIEWEFKYLLKHLIEEREWFRENGERRIESE